MLKGKTNQKQTFLGGAAVLAAATAIVKILGAIYKIPLRQLLGRSGFGFFNTAYDIYSVLLMISTTGLPVAMSRMISEARTLGQTNQIRQIYRSARLVFLLIGVVGFAGMALLCKQLAAVMSQQESWFAILCLSPAVLFVCMISTDRGFFQGQSNMMPTSISQVFEAVCKLVVGLGAAFVVKKATGNMIYASGAAILGVTASTLVSVLYLRSKRKLALAELEQEECLDSTIYGRKETIVNLLTIAVPITLGAAGLQLITAVDTAVYMARLKGAAGFDTETANDLKGLYNFAQTIFNLPCAFITPLTISVIPAITEQLTLRRRRSANTVAESAVRVMGLIALPCSVGLTVLASPITQLLERESGEGLRIGALLLAILGFCVFFNSFVLVMNAIMQAHGYVYIPVINMIVGGIVKVIINYILVGNPKINIVGAPIGTLVCYIIIAGLNVFAIRQVLPKPPRLLSILVKPLIASVIMGAVAYGANRLLLAARLPVILRTGGAIAAAGAVYLVLVLVLKIITAEDCKLLPKGDKIAKLLKIH